MKSSLFTPSGLLFHPSSPRVSLQGAALLWRNSLFQMSKQKKDANHQW
jgi:hypothetical protein